MKTNLYLGKYRDDLKLSWPQVKRKYPQMKPSGDSDFDGTLNFRDCRPLNPAMDSRFTEWVKRKIKERRKGAKEREIRTIARKRKVIRVLKKAVAGVEPRYKKFGVGVRRIIMKEGRRQKVKAGPGRPAGVYKHISPLTGKRVPATTYYSHRKEARRRLRTQAQQSQIREQAMMARRGVPPQVTRMRQMQRIQQPQFPPQIQQVQQYPKQIPIQQTPLQRPQQYRVVTDIMTGRRIIKPIPPRERWTMKGG